MKWLRSQGAVFEEETCEYATLRGNIETLEWLVRSGSFTMGKDTFLQATTSGNITVVEYCVENDVPFEDRLYECIIESFDDPVPVIKLLQNNGYPWHSSACHAAASQNDLKLLRWLRFNCCPWDESVCNEAVKNDKYDILMYAHENGCAWTKETYAYCFSEDGLHGEYDEIPFETTEPTNSIICSEKVFEYLQKHHCPRPDPSDWRIVGDNWDY